MHKTQTHALSLKIAHFILRTGNIPENDDLDRAYCKDAGKPGHLQCGWCLKHDKPRFMCGCLWPIV